jgi:DNA-binding GntR family transcriptional regulator
LPNANLINFLAFNPNDKTVVNIHGLRRQAVEQSLLAEIFHGRLRAGQRLVTQDLAERFGVSHTPIREALIALAGIGILELLPYRGAVVRAVTPRDVREVCLVRRALECEATRGACGRIRPAELVALTTALKRLRDGRAPRKGTLYDEARAVDTRLHDLIASNCGNAFLAKELGRLTMLFRAFRDVSYKHHEAHNDYGRIAEEAGEHLAIVQALRAGDRRAAMRAMARHIKSGVTYWTRSLPKAATESQP